MAKIRLPDIPQAPGIGGPPQAVNYPMPNVSPNVRPITYNPARLPAPRKVNPRLLESPVDFQGKIPGLMQQGIDPGPYRAAGRASMASAAAIGEAGQEIGGALTDLGTSLRIRQEANDNLAQAMQTSKDMADKSRARNLMRTGIAAFEEKAVNVPLSERQALWDEEYQPKIDEAIRSLNPSAYAADQIYPEWELAQIHQRTQINADARDEIIKNDTASILEEHDAATASGDWATVDDTITRMELAKLQTPAQIATKRRQLVDNKTAWDLQALVSENPRAALQEIEEYETTGKNSDFPNLNPAIAAKAKNGARAEVSKREQDADEFIRLGMESGKIKNRADIEEAAKGNLTEDSIQSYQRILAANPEYSSEAVVKARTNAENYKPEEDPDLSKRRAIIEQIGTTVSKTEQKPIYDILENRTKGTKGDQDPPQWYADSLMKQVEELTKNGYFDVSESKSFTLPGIYSLFGPIGTTAGEKYDRKRAEKEPLYAIAHKEEEAAAWARAKSVQDSMRQWLIANPKASPKEAQEELTKMIGHSPVQVGWDARKRKTPETEAVPTQEATPAPMRVPGGPPTTSFRGESHTVAKITAYRPGGTWEMGVNPKVEGGPLDAHGNMILGKSTMEDYAAGRGNYVTVAMDKESDWQGKYLISEAFPGVVFRVMDNGGYGNGKTGRNWIDIAWKDPARAKKFLRRDVTFRAVDYQDARKLAKARFSA